MNDMLLFDYVNLKSEKFWTLRFWVITTYVHWKVLILHIKFTWTFSQGENKLEPSKLHVTWELNKESQSENVGGLYRDLWESFKYVLSTTMCSKLF